MENNTVLRGIFNEMCDAIEMGSIDKVKELIGDEEERLNLMTPFGTWLHVAAKFGKLEIVKYFVEEKGLDVNRKDEGLKTVALNGAAANGHIEIVKYLLDCGSEIDVSTMNRNPIRAATCGGHKDIVELLLERDIDISIKYPSQSWGYLDVYTYALHMGQLEIADLLNIDTSNVSNEIKNEIKNAIEEGNLKKVKELISNDDERLNMMTGYGTWLQLAARCGELEIVKYLAREKGVDINRKHNGLKTLALNDAAQGGNIEVVKYLLDCGSEIDVSSFEVNPIGPAIARGYKEIVYLLVETCISRGIKYPSEEVQYGDLHEYAIHCGEREIIEFLKSKM